MVDGQDGSLWVGTQKGLDRLDLDSGAFEHFTSDLDDPGTLPHPWVYDLYRDHDGRIWVATVGGGVAWVDPRNGRVTRVPIAEASVTVMWPV